MKTGLEICTVVEVLKIDTLRKNSKNKIRTVGGQWSPHLGSRENEKEGTDGRSVSKEVRGKANSGRKGYRHSASC